MNKVGPGQRRGLASDPVGVSWGHGQNESLVFRFLFICFLTWPPSASTFILILLLGHQCHGVNKAISPRIQVSCYVGAGSSFHGTPHRNLRD